MKKTISKKISVIIMIAIFTFAFLTVFTACSDKPKKEQSQDVAESSQTEILSSDKVEESKDEVTDFTAEKVDGKSAEYEGDDGILNLEADGTFILKPRMYDGYPEITGTYTESSGEYVLSPKETNAQNIELSEYGEMRLEITDSGVIYRGNEVGELKDGSELYIK